VFQLLTNLNSCFEQTRSQILLSAYLSSLKKVASIIEQEKARHTVMRGPHVWADEEHNSHALITRHQRNHNFKGKNIAQAKCAHCKQLGHKQETCWFLHPELRPAGWIDKGDRGRKKEKDLWRGKRGDTLSKREEPRIFSTKMILDSAQTEMDRPISVPKDGSAGQDPVQQIFHKFSLWYWKKNYDGISLNSFSNLNNQIILDSGVTNHMFCNKKLLTNLKLINDDKYVCVANGIKEKINGIGEINLFLTKIKNILYIESFSTNLISISKLTQELNYNINFSSKIIEFQDQETEKMIGKEKRKITYIFSNLKRRSVFW
jgi:hypothetical protein